MPYKYIFAFLVIYLSVHCVRSSTEEKNGVIFVEDTEISIGFSVWRVLSVFNSNLLVESYYRAEHLKNQLYKLFTTSKESPKSFQNKLVSKDTKPYQTIKPGLLADARDYNSQQQFNHMNRKSEIAKQKLQELDVYLGNEKRIEKRDFGSAAASVGSLFYKLAADLFGIQSKTELEKRMEEFVAIFQPQYDQLNKRIQEITSFNEVQVSYNRQLVSEISGLEDKYQFLEKEMSQLKTDLESRLKIQYLIGFLLETFEEFINIQEKILQGLIEASQGFPSPTFLAPSKILHVLLNYQELGHLEKSIFGRDDVLQLYNLASSYVTKVGDEVGVLSTIKIPTSSTKARLHRIISFPIHQQENNAFITLKHKYKYIAVNGQNKYQLLNDEDLNSCVHTSTMILCESGNQVWKNRDDPTCEGSLWFEDEHLTQSLCDYEIEEAKVPKLTYINEGTFHFAMPRQWSVPFECTGELQTSENVQLENNGFINLSPRCVASVQSHLLRNLLTDNVKTFTTKDDVSHHNVEEIRNAKLTAAIAEAETQKEEISLTNADILESILHEKAIEAKEDEIANIFEQTRLDLGLTEEERQDREETLQEEENEDTVVKSNLKTMIVLVSFVAFMVFIIISLMIYTFIYIRK